MYENFDFNSSLEKLIGIDSLSDKILTVYKDEISYRKEIEKIKDALEILKSSKINQERFLYRCQSNEDSIFFLDLNRKDFVQQLERDNMEMKLKINNARSIKEKLIKNFIGKYKEEDYLHLEPAFISLINEYKANIMEDEGE